jgi:hypothetical protein
MTKKNSFSKYGYCIYSSVATIQKYFNEWIIVKKIKIILSEVYNNNI